MHVELDVNCGLHTQVKLLSATKCRRNFDQALIYHIMFHCIMNKCLLKSWCMPNHGVWEMFCRGFIWRKREFFLHISPNVMQRIFLHNQIILFFLNSYWFWKFNFSCVKVILPLQVSLRESLWSGRSWEEFHKKTCVEAVTWKGSSDNTQSLPPRVHRRVVSDSGILSTCWNKLFSSKFSGRTKTNFKFSFYLNFTIFSLLLLSFSQLHSPILAVCWGPSVIAFLRQCQRAVFEE